MVRGDVMSRSIIKQKADLGETLNGELIIDIHCHMGSYFNFWVCEGHAEGMLRAMDRVGVKIACPSHHWIVSGDFRAGNDAVADAQRRYPERFIGFIGVNPNYADGVEEEIRRMSARGMKHLKIHSIHAISYEDKKYDPVFEWAEANETCVVAHTWGGKDLDQLANRARRHPRARCIAAHAGCSEADKYIELARTIKNLYLEICLSAAPYGMVEKLVRGAGAEKVLYGSDMPFYSMNPTIGRVLWARMSDDEKRRVLGLNARELLALPVCPPLR